MTEIISKCTHGIDLHTGNIHSENLPHVRLNLDVPGALKMARAFNVPVIVNAKLRDGSLRQAATELNIPMLVYEAGEALRFNELAIRIGLRGVLNVLHALGMLEKPIKQTKIKSKVAHQSSWVRSPESGILHPLNTLGNDVEEGEKLGIIASPFTKNETEIVANMAGFVIGKNTLPLVNEGDALFHIAKLNEVDEVESDMNNLRHDVASDPDFF
jgi:hypothetical protein